MISQGLRNYVRPSVRELLPRHIAKRKKFAEEHLDWTVDDWKRVMFSDEAIFSTSMAAGRRTHYRRPEHNGLERGDVRETKHTGQSQLMF